MTRFFHNTRNIEWRNTHGTTCPPYGLVKVTGWETVAANYVRITGTQPAVADAGDSLYVINGPAAVAASKTGYCYHQDIAVVTSDEVTALGDTLTTKAGWTVEVDGTGNPVLMAMGVKDANGRVLVSWLGSRCDGLKATFGLADYEASDPNTVVAVVPKWTVVDGEITECSYEEVKDCPAAAPLQTIFDTEADLVATHDPTAFPSGTQFYVVDETDPDNLKSDIYAVQGPVGGLGVALQRVGGLSPAEEEQLAFWAVNQ